MPCLLPWKNCEILYVAPSDVSAIGNKFSKVSFVMSVLLDEFRERH